MSGPGDMVFPMPLDFNNIKAEIKEEYAGNPAPKKRGRKKGSKNQKQTTITDTMPVRKKRDRFNGMPEEEVVKRLLPDHLAPDLDIVIVGINPGLCAAYVGHHYAGPGNHFWKCMYLSGLIPEPLTANDDFKLLNYGIGFTNIVARTTRGSADLSRKEIKEGAQILTEKLQKYKPKIAVFNGKGIYEVFVGHKNFAIGKQPDLLPGTETTVYVMPSSSARCSQLPRAVDKVPFYASLKKLRDYLRGDLKELDDSEVCFPDLELKVVKREPKKEVKEEIDSSCSQSDQYSQSCESGYPPSNMSIKQEPGYNQSQFGMHCNPNPYQMCPTSSNHNPSSYCNTPPNFNTAQNGAAQYPMMGNTGDGNYQNGGMSQNSMGDNFHMSQVMMQGQPSQNFQMFQGQMQTFSGNNSNQFSFQQNMQINGVSNSVSGQIMVQSSFQGQGQHFSMGAQNFQSSNNYQQNMSEQGNYSPYQNQQQQQPNFNQQNTSQNETSEYDGVTFMGYNQGHLPEGQYSQSQGGFIKQEPKDFTEIGGSCNGGSSQTHQGQGMNFQGQNSMSHIQIKEEPKDFGDYSQNGCQNR